MIHLTPAYTEAAVAEAERLAAFYHDDPRAGIDIDVRNSFYQGVRFAKERADDELVTIRRAAFTLMTWWAAEQSGKGEPIPDDLAVLPFIGSAGAPAVTAGALRALMKAVFGDLDGADRFKASSTALTKDQHD